MLRKAFQIARAGILLTAATLFTLAGWGTTAAQAAPAGCHHVHQQTGDNYGILDGTQIYAPVDVGLDVTGNALALLGQATAHSRHTTRIRCR